MDLLIYSSRFEESILFVAFINWLPSAKKRPKRIPKNPQERRRNLSKKNPDETFQNLERISKMDVMKTTKPRQDKSQNDRITDPNSSSCCST